MFIRSFENKIYNIPNKKVFDFNLRMLKCVYVCTVVVFRSNLLLIFENKKKILKAMIFFNLRLKYSLKKNTKNSKLITSNTLYPIFLTKSF